MKTRPRCHTRAAAQGPKSCSLRVYSRPPSGRIAPRCGVRECGMVTVGAFMAKVKVFTNNDIAYVWWSVPAKIPGCLGFSLHREIEGRAPKPLPAWVGFERTRQ